MRTAERVFPRACFVCERQMRTVPSTTTLWCRECDIFEAGTISGRWLTERRECVIFGEDVIFFTDHGGELCFPTPDSEGFQRGPVQVA
jgi:hypothetical protein